MLFRISCHTLMINISAYEQSLPENAFEVQVKKIQLSLYKHYENEKGNLYNPKDMEEFVAKHSPGLWATLLKALTGDRGVLTNERADLQKRRTVALLHIIAYFR